LAWPRATSPLRDRSSSRRSPSTSQIDFALPSHPRKRPEGAHLAGLPSWGIGPLVPCLRSLGGTANCHRFMMLRRRTHRRACTTRACRPSTSRIAPRTADAPASHGIIIPAG
jgi:hypothetical protein